ncbi:MAG: serine/threonine protein kinase [Chloroflexi bacterium]|nr:serine/threonine protein kinase [Chloroflexota bacterium]
MSFKPGANVGPYQVMEQLGQGGMASVYKAYHAALDRYVALKVLHQAFNEDSTFISRFQREARVVARLEHSNIVPVYDYAEHEGRPYLVMKFIEGDTLKARLIQGPLTAAEIEQVVDSVGSALAYAHKQGVLHRDIKPSNVLISTDHVMYLADFGLARIAQDGESTLSADSIMGTPQYISPEQAMGKKDLDNKTDIYSFGVMLYEMVVGRVPFTADTPFSIIHDHIYSPLPLPRAVNPEVPEPVERVLLKSLAKDRLDRYETVEELAHAFKQAWVDSGVPMQGTSVKMRPASLKEPSKAQSVDQAARTEIAKSPAPKRSPTWAWISGGLVVILCCAVGWVAFRNNPRALFPRRTPVAIATATVAPVATDTAVPTPATVLDESPEITAARAAVQNNPGDPNAHLQLSLALWDDGHKKPSYETLAQAANLAGTNKDFFMTAAQEFKSREAWVPTAGMYLRLAGFGPRENIPPDIQEGLRESVYKATSEEEMPLYVFFERVDAFDLPLGYVVRGRYALYHGAVEDAKLQLANAQAVQSDMYEAFLLKAEIEMQVGSREAAKNLLLSLSSDLGAAPWIRDMATEFLTTIQ